MIRIIQIETVINKKIIITTTNKQQRHHQEPSLVHELLVPFPIWLAGIPSPPPQTHKAVQSSGASRKTPVSHLNKQRCGKHETESKQHTSTRFSVPWYAGYIT